MVDSAAVDWAVNVAKGLRRFVVASLPPVADESASALEQQASAPFAFAIPSPTGRAAAVYEAEVARIAMRREFLATVASRVNGGSVRSPETVEVTAPDGFVMYVNVTGHNGMARIRAYQTATVTLSVSQLEVMAVLRKDTQSLVEQMGISLSWDPQRLFSVGGSSPFPAISRLPNGWEVLADDALDWTVGAVEAIQRYVLAPIAAGTLRPAGTSSPEARPAPPAAPRDCVPAVPAQLPTSPEAEPAGRYGPAAVLVEAGDYRRKTATLEYAQAGRSRRRRAAVVLRPARSPVARALVVARSERCCENPACLSPGFRAMTDDGDPIVEVDHVVGLADGGEDHPANMIALCPNCHALKTRGHGREALQESLREVARGRHAEAMEGRLGVSAS
ncbi:HNH endonuclease [Kitasatospora sp. NPDC001574]